MKFAFLVYVSRSGSTMLARHLTDDAKDLIVLPEFNFLIWLARAGDAAVRALSADQLFDVVRSDYQLTNLNLQNYDLRALTALWTKQGLRAIAEQTVCLYAESIGRRTPDYAILKKGRYLSYTNQIRQSFPEALFIHIYRDPHATVNSMLRTPTIYFPDQNMARGDAIFAARHWSAYMDNVRKLQAAGVPIVEVQYEELCRFPAQTVQSILNRIGSKPSAEKVAVAQSNFQVSDAEQEIHRHIHEQPILERLDAWKSELTPLQGIAVEWVSEKAMAARGYPLWFMETTPPLKTYTYKLLALLVHFWRTGIFYLNRVLFFAARRSEVWPRVRLMLRTRLKHTARRLTEVRGSQIRTP